MDYFLKTYMDGKDKQTFFGEMGLDPIFWVDELLYTQEQQENWRIEQEEISDPQYRTIRYTIHTPVKPLTMVLQYNQ